MTAQTYFKKNGTVFGVEHNGDPENFKVHEVREFNDLDKFLEWGTAKPNRVFATKSDVKYYNKYR